jgi:DNA-binding winged helix-turn-helix (wHTH) protein
MRIYSFAGFELDTRVMQLRCSSSSVPIEPLPFRVMWYLIEHRDRAVSNAELGAELWNVAHVNPNAIARAVRQVRRALGVDAHNDPFLRTVQRYGYQWKHVVTLLPCLAEPAVDALMPG